MNWNYLIVMASTVSGLVASVRIFTRLSERSPAAWMVGYIDLAMLGILFVSWGVVMALVVPRWQPRPGRVLPVIATVLSLPAIVIAIIGWHL